MGCGNTCSYFHGKRYQDWVSDGPAGQDLDHVRHIRDQIRQPVFGGAELQGGADEPGLAAGRAVMAALRTRLRIGV